MKRVDAVAVLSRCGWCRAATIATALRTGRGCAATAGALPSTDMQIAQRLEWWDVSAWV